MALPEINKTQVVKTKIKLNVLSKIFLGLTVIVASASIMINLALMFVGVARQITDQSIEALQRAPILPEKGITVKMYESASPCTSCGGSGKSYNIDIKGNYDPEVDPAKIVDELVQVVTDNLKSQNLRSKFPNLNYDKMIGEINTPIFKDFVMGKIDQKKLTQGLDWICNGQNGCTPIGAGSCDLDDPNSNWNPWNSAINNSSGPGNANFGNFGGGGGGSGFCIGGGVGGPGIGCLLKGTKVALADGSYKNVEEIKEGDMVKAYDTDNQKMVNSVVENTFHNKANEYIVINNKLRLTPKHALFINNQWVSAKDAKIGDKILAEDGQQITVQSVKKVNEDNIDIYNFMVKNYRNYFVDGYLVHNINFKTNINSGYIKIVIHF